VQRGAKQGFYRRVIEELVVGPGLHPRDVFIHLPETAKENGSFGDGAAPYA